MQAKMEVHKTMAFNPVVQDLKCKEEHCKLRECVTKPPSPPHPSRPESVPA